MSLLLFSPPTITGSLSKVFKQVTGRSEFSGYLCWEEESLREAIWSTDYILLHNLDSDYTFVHFVNFFQLSAYDIWTFYMYVILQQQKINLPDHEDILKKVGNSEKWDSSV